MTRSGCYRDGDLLSAPARYVETTPVAPGTSTMAELDTPVPGPIHMVDHALSQAGLEISWSTEVNRRWTGDGGYHNVSDTGGAFESDLADENDFTFAHTFQETGVYKYECTPHVSVGMKGAVVVSE